MSFSRMKPLPKALIIATVVGLGIFAAAKFMPEPKPQAPAAPVEAVSTPTQPAVAASKVETPAPAPVAVMPQEPPALQPAPTPDAGVANVLKSVK